MQVAADFGGGVGPVLRDEVGEDDGACFGVVGGGFCGGGGGCFAGWHGGEVEDGGLDGLGLMDGMGWRCLV